MANYLDRIEYHKELTQCKLNGNLSQRAIDMFTVHATELTRCYFFENEDDRKDAIQMALYDALKYWKGFKHMDLIHMKFNRNMVNGDKIHVLFNDNNGVMIDKVLQASNYSSQDDQFDINSNKINKTIENFLSCFSKFISGDHIQLFHDRVKSKITMMKCHPSIDLQIKSMPITPGLLASDRKTKCDGINYKMQPPPNCFNYFTSLLRNGILKSLNENKPKQWRNGKIMSIDRTKNGDGMYTI